MNITNKNIKAQILINQATYSLPCRGFIFDYAISKKRQLPVVKEFVVRFLYSLESCSPDLISEFFGFSSTEIQAVLSGLAEERLIKWEDENVKLTEYALERFEVEDGKMIPRFFKIEDAIDTVVFDLHSFKLLYSQLKGQSRQPIGIDIPLPEDAYTKASDRAKTAFDEQFMVFREKVKGVDIFKDQDELYKINNVRGKFDNLLPINVDYYIDASNPKNITLEYESDYVNEWDINKDLFTSIRKTYDSRNKLDQFDLAAEFNSYLSATKDPFLSRFWVKDGIDLSLAMNNYMNDMSLQSGQTRMIVGNLYTRTNREILKAMLIGDPTREMKFKSPGGLWFINPENKTWGRTKQTEEFIKEIDSRFDKRKKTSKMVIVVACESSKDASRFQQIYYNSGLTLMASNKSFGGSFTEVFIVPDVVVACLFHIQNNLNQSLSIPIGYVTTDVNLINKVLDEADKWSRDSDCFESYFFKNDSNGFESLLNNVIFPTLDYVDEEK